MEKEFVTYNQALRLKALGFDEPCSGYYSEGELIPNSHTNNYMQRFRYSAPTFSQTFRWFREKYGLYSWVKLHNGYVNDSFYEKLPITWTIMEHESGKQHYEKDTDNYLYHTHEEAELACLEKLIEIVETKSE